MNSSPELGAGKYMKMEIQKLVSGRMSPGQSVVLVQADWQGRYIDRIDRRYSYMSRSGS